MPINENTCSNPEIPQYAPEPPADGNCGCMSNHPSFYSSGQTPGKVVEVIDGDDITVDNLSDAGTYRFRPNYDPHIALTAQLSAPVPYIAGVNALANNLVLFGRTVDRVDLTWTYNKAVTVQSLASSLPGFVPPTLLLGDRAKSLTGLAITVDTSFTITGNDGEAKPGSVASSLNWVRYGNLVRWGKGLEKLNGLASGLQALFDALAGSINTNTRARSFFATGAVNEHEFYFLPVRFGTVTFQKGIFVGGFIRLKNVAGVLKQTLVGGDVEIPISISNGIASENYYVYQSLYDNQVDAVTPIVAS